MPSNSVPEKYWSLSDIDLPWQELLVKLENTIAGIKLGPNGFTAPGQFLFELFQKIALDAKNCPQMVFLLEDAMGLLSGEAAEQGRK